MDEITQIAINECKKIYEDNNVVFNKVNVETWVNRIRHKNPVQTEFWRNVDANSPQFGKYIMSNSIDIFSPTVQLNDKSITLPNKRFRKTSLFSLVYRINSIVPDKFKN